MILLESTTEIAIGVGVESLVFAVFVGVIYRTFSGRFVIPKREVVLPNQRGVIVQGEQVVRVAEPGTCWVKPKQRIVLVDARPRPLQMAGLEVLGSDNGILRVSVSGEYQIGDAAMYYASSTNANDALFVQIRRLLSTVARRQPGSATVASPESFAVAVQTELAIEAASLGFSVIRFQVWDVAQLGFLRQSESYTRTVDLPHSGLIH